MKPIVRKIKGINDNDKGKVVNQQVESVNDKAVKRAGKHNASINLLNRINAVRTTEIYPLDAPGIPLLSKNSNFLEYLISKGSSPTFEKKQIEGKKSKTEVVCYDSEIYNTVKAALRDPQFTMPVEVGAFRTKEVTFLPGHIWGDPKTEGPKPAKIMIINKTPWKEELASKRALQGEDGVLLAKLFTQYKINYAKAYVTHLVKFTPPEFKSTLRASWIKDGIHLLMHEIKIVQPDYILCLGSEVSKALFDSDASLVNTAGKVLDFEYTTAFTYDRAEEFKKVAKVIVSTHPKQVVRDTSLMRQLEADIGRFCGLVQGQAVGDEEVVHHSMLSTDAEIIESLISIENDEDKTDDVIAVDAEWHGEHPINAGSYLRFIQLSWKPKYAYAFKIHEQGGAKNEAVTTLSFEALNAFFKGGSFSYVDSTGQSVTVNFRPKRVVGQFFNADLEWLVAYGLNIQKQFMCPIDDIKLSDIKDPNLRQQYSEYAFKKNDIIPAWFRTKFEGGADTGLMAHAIEETANFKLEILAMRFTTAPRYDTKLQKWKTDYCKQNGISDKNLEGYGECPDDVLAPYGCYDADVTLRLFYKFDVLLDDDFEHNNCREAFWESQVATPAVLDIHLNGILVDKNRIDFLSAKFLEAKLTLEAKIRKQINWPNFNIRSLLDTKELLFGEVVAGRRDKETGNFKQGRPPGALCLNIDPIFDTSKPPKLWSQLKQFNQHLEASPSTNKQALSLLAQEHASNNLTFNIINNLRDYRFLDQVLKTILRPPLVDEDTEEELRDDDGNFSYSDGLASMLCDDGKVRTHIYQTKETGRWSSARPNLQNISKQRDPDYKRLLGEHYKYSLRSVLKASPGYVLVEADYVGAELFGMAVMSGDKTMIEHATRNQLPEDHPDYYDIHSNVAVFAFKLNCAPTKQGLESIGKKHLRIIAKCVPAHVRLQTDQGWLRMGTLCGELDKDKAIDVSESGISVGSLYGKTTLMALYNGGLKPCHRIETERGYRLDAAEDHHVVIMGLDGKLDFKKASQVAVGDYVVIRMGNDTFGQCVEFPQISVDKRTNYKELNLPAEFNDDWAAFLGLYIAEGSIDDDHSVSISLAYEEDPQLCNETRKLFRGIVGARFSEIEVQHTNYQNQKKFNISSVKLATWLKENAPGDSHTKVVPEFVFKWPKYLQATFLRWLFEGDGSIKKNGNGVSVTYSTASEALARDIVTLLSGFGIEVTLSSETREGYDGVYWVVNLYSNEARNRFATDIGFITEADKLVFEQGTEELTRCDRRVIPNQVDWLIKLLPAVRSPIKEKCRECVRKKQRVNLNPTRLDLILSAVDETKLNDSSREAFLHLLNLSKLELSYQQVRSNTDLGVLPVYDVETTPKNMHVVNYDGFLTHQSVIFGIAYGRQAKAIVVAAKEQNVSITVQEAQNVIDAIFAMYPGLIPFFEECRNRATGLFVDPKTKEHPEFNYLCNCFGRFRRFPKTNDLGIRSEFERQAMNYPLQSMIASAVSRAIGKMSYRRLDLIEKSGKQDTFFRFLLQIHDAILFEVKYDKVAYFCEKFLPKYMRRSVPIYPTNLDGMPTGDGPYYLGVEVEVMEHWGEKITDKRVKELGLPVGHAKADGVVIHYSKPMETKDVKKIKPRKTGLRKIKPIEYKHKAKKC